MLRDRPRTSRSSKDVDSPPPPPRITAILRKQMHRSVGPDSRRKATVRYHPCTLISDTDIYDPGIMRIPSPNASQRHDMKVQFGEVVHRVKGRGDNGAGSTAPNWGQGAGNVTPNWGRITPGEEVGRNVKEEDLGEDIEREEDRLRSEVRNISKKGNLNLQQVGSILQGSEGFYKRKNGKPTPITLSVEQVEEYECAFKQFDINGDGVITTVELGAMLRSIGLNPSHKEIQEMIAEVDCNGDGIIDFCEFLKMMSRHSNPGVDPEQQLAEVFRLFDKDRSGYITQDELRSVMLSLGQPLSDEQLRDMIAYADLDGDGKINLKEFIKIMTTDTKCR